MTAKLFYSKNLTVILILFLTSLALTAIWFQKGNLFLGAEEGMPFYNLEYSLKIFSSTWLEQFLGVAYLTDIVKIPFFTILAFLNSIGLSNFFLQVSTFFVILFGGSTSVFFLFQSLFKKNLSSSFPAFFASIFYLLNPYVVGDVWSRGLYSQFFAYFYYPLFLWMFVLFLQTKKNIFLVIGWLSSFVLSVGMGNPSYAISLWSLMGIFLLFYLIENLSSKQKLIFALLSFLVYFFGWCVINSWWLVIFLKFAAGAYLTTGSGFYNALESLEAVSKQSGFLNTIRLFHAIRFGPDFYGNVYDSYWLIGISYLVPLIAASSVFFYKVKAFKFLAGLFVVGLVVCLGTTPPLGFLFRFFFEHLSIVQVFRNPYEKFGLVYLLAYSGLFGLGLFGICSILGRYLKRLSVWTLSLLIFLVCGALIWPMWTGDVIGWGTQSKVHPRYEEFDNWQKEQNPGKQRILFLPLLPSLGASFHWIGGDYHGGEPIHQMIDSPVVSQTGINPYLNALKKEVGQMDISGGLSLIGTGWIVNRPDVEAEENDRQDLTKILSFKSDGLRNAGSVAGMTVYEIENPKPIREIGSFSQILPVLDYQDLFTQANLADVRKVGFLIDGQNKQKFPVNDHPLSTLRSTEKISSTLFHLQFDNNDQKYIYLSKTFDPQWKVITGVSQDEVDNSFFNNFKLLLKPRVSEENHFVVNGYANLWTVSSSDSANIAIVYTPQIVKNIFWMISLSNFWIMTLFVLYKVLTLIIFKR